MTQSREVGGEMEYYSTSSHSKGEETLKMKCQPPAQGDARENRQKERGWTISSEQDGWRNHPSSSIVTHSSKNTECSTLPGSAKKQDTTLVFEKPTLQGYI